MVWQEYGEISSPLNFFAQMEKGDEIMTVELTSKLIELIGTLPDTTQILIYLGIYTLTPLLIVWLYVLNRNQEIENYKKEMRQQIERQA